MRSGRAQRVCRDAAEPVGPDGGRLAGQPVSDGDTRRPHGGDPAPAPLPRPMPPPTARPHVGPRVGPHAGPVAGDGHELAHSGPPMSASMAFGGGLVMLGAGLALVVLYRSRYER
ncbi:hypothetical protein ACQEVX_13060 [Streptomyces syringium]|uniref:hypothetical protein n=1 Tax=Streptomyces syringium TaxID=76729 RepID=UPI003D8E1258